MIKNNKLFITIGWLYPELMSTYGDGGNIIALKNRCEWRSIKSEVKHLDLGFKINNLRKCDLLFMGGAQDRQQKIVAVDLKDKQKELSGMIENGIPGLYICGAYQFLGKYYKETDGTIINGLGIFDLYTESPGEDAQRLIGNIVVNIKGSSLLTNKKSRGVLPSPPQGWNSIDTLVGFENHGGRTYLGKNVKPLGTVKVGFGNNGEDKTEGAVYKNSIGSYLHGPILPKNPHLADWLIKTTLEKKYRESIHLKPLDDSLEWQAHNAIVSRLDTPV